MWSFPWYTLFCPSYPSWICIWSLPFCKMGLGAENSGLKTTSLKQWICSEIILWLKLFWLRSRAIKDLNTVTDIFEDSNWQCVQCIGFDEICQEAWIPFEKCEWPVWSEMIRNFRRGSHCTFQLFFVKNAEDYFCMYHHQWLSFNFNWNIFGYWITWNASQSATVV